MKQLSFILMFLLSACATNSNINSANDGFGKWSWSTLTDKSSDQALFFISWTVGVDENDDVIKLSLKKRGEKLCQGKILESSYKVMDDTKENLSSAGNNIFMPTYHKTQTLLGLVKCKTKPLKTDFSNEKKD